MEWQMKLLLISSFFIFYPNLFYPLFLRGLARVFRRPWKTAPQFPSVSILIAAHNEEKGIRDKIENTLALKYPQDRLEILIASDGSTDESDSILNEYVGRVHFFRTKGRVGKQVALNQIVEKAKGEIFVFTDVGLLLEPSALEKIVRSYADSRIGAVSGSVAIRRPPSSLASDNGEAGYLGWDARIRYLEGQVSSITGCCGLIYSIRRDCHVPFVPSVANDLAAALDVVRIGRNAVVDPEVIGYSRSANDYRKEFRRKVRTIVGGIDAVWRSGVLIWGLRFPLFYFLLISHKILRWMSPIAMVVALGSIGAGALSGVPYFAHLSVLSLTFLSLGSIGLLFSHDSLRHSPLRYFTFLLVSMTAGFFACFEFALGKKYVTWGPTHRDRIDDVHLVTEAPEEVPLSKTGTGK